MDKLSKLLKKLTSAERTRVIDVLSKLISGETSSLDIKKLKGVDDVYRVRIGTIRIIYRKTKDDLLVLDIGRRSDTTYREF